MKITYLSENESNQWDNLVKGNLESGFMQSWEWSKFKEKEGQQVIRLGVMSDESLVAGSIVYYVKSSFAVSPLIIPHGPVLPWKSSNDEAQKCFELIYGELQNISQEIESPLIRIEPLLCGPLPAWLSSFIKAPIDLIPTPTLVIDISKSCDDILSSMKPKGRYNIGLALKKGVEVFSSDNSDAVCDFYSLFELTCKRHDFAGEPKKFFINMINSTQKMSRIYFASYHGILISSAIVIFFGDYATFLYGGSIPFLRHLMAPYAMHWHIINDAKAIGCKYYDFFGIAPPNIPYHPYTRFSQFKSRFGGTIVTTIGAHDSYFYPQLAKLWVDKYQNFLF
ncbi:MAG: peptidoglycan bridge formation glycyltransferase FemA/FemB family protein [Desulfobacterales bacterium]|nr:peptidoglycan bridge formation glycyltransferase FemA/FemB family protein [Desulfobacterales bacterium]